MKSKVRRFTSVHGIVWLTLVFAWTFGTASPAHAQNLRDVPLGGRTAAMGSTGVAAGVDAAMPFLNPAGVAGTPHDILSLSANVYSGLGARVDHYYAPNGLDSRYGDAHIDEDGLDQKHLAVMPSSVTYFKRFGGDEESFRHVLALSLLAPSFSQLDVHGRFRADGTIHRLMADTRGEERFRQVFAGPTYALTAGGRRFRVGISAFVTYADLLTDAQRLTLTAQREAGADSIETTNERSIVDVFSFGLTGVIGAQLRVIDALWIGVAAESMGIPIYGSGTTERNVDEASSNAVSGLAIQRRANAYSGLDDVAISRPFRLSGGIAYDRPDMLALGADIHFLPAHATFRKWSGTSQVTRAESGSGLTETEEDLLFERGTRATVNFSAGGEVHVSRTFAIRAGFYTDRDVVEEQTAGQGAPNSRLDWLVFTLGLGHSVGAVGASYGIAYRRGNGTMYARDTFGSDPSRIVGVDYTAHGIMLMLSGAVTTDDDDKQKKPPAE
jgi:hypothetical protein